MDISYILLIGIFMLICLMTIGMIAVYRQSERGRQQEFQIKLEAATAAKNKHIMDMSAKELLDIIKDTMVYYVDREIMVTGVLSDSDEEKSIQFNDMLIDICSSVEMSISDDIKTALKFYYTEEYIRIYIRDSCRILLVARIEQKIMQNKPTKSDQV